MCLIFFQNTSSDSIKCDLDWISLFGFYNSMSNCYVKTTHEIY